ncbi:MAG: DUF3306 domain-containing protein [Acidovorax sp.]|uniref:DUF3306 domain-containing protein n=1 Tax=Acidovorax sp. TaxID=1872122 RepID=UPI00391C8E4D
MADGFLGRWSRRKQEVREGKPVEEPPTPVPPLASSPSVGPSMAPASSSAVAPGSAAGAAPEAAAPAEAPPPTLADAQALTPTSDFKAFVAHDVAPEVRNLAMKKLFSDPHFNVMDGLDIYIGDYTQPDPLPEGMLRKMTSAHALGFFDHEKKAEAAASTVGATDGVALDVGADPVAHTQPDVNAIAPAVAQPRDDAEEETRSDVAQSEVCNAIPSDPSSELALVTGSPGDAVAMPASHTEHDHDAHLRLQPDDAPQREGVGRGTA